MNKRQFDRQGNCNSHDIVPMRVAGCDSEMDRRVSEREAIREGLLLEQQ